MIVTVCGLHGGAGATTVAVLLATAAARRAPGQVLLCDADPGSGDLARALHAASPHNLAELARLIAADRRPTVTPSIDLDGGLRLLARDPAPRAGAPAAATARVLADAAAAHELVVVDAGPLTAAHSTAALHAADVVLWAIDATAQLEPCAQLLGSAHTAAAHNARGLLAASDTGRAGTTATAAQLGDLIPSLQQLILVPTIGRLDGPQSASAITAGQQLLSAITAATPNP